MVYKEREESAMILTCADFEKAGLWDTANCCVTCHSDDDLDIAFSMREVYPPANRWGKRPKRIYGYVCCIFRIQSNRSLDVWKPTRDEWAKAARAKHTEWLLVEKSIDSRPER